MTQKSSSGSRPKAKRGKREKLDFVQDFLPVRNISHGIVELTDGRYIKILEIEPINFMLRSDEEQFSIISSFASWLKISPMQLQFKSITRRADSDKHVAMIRQELEQEESLECRALAEDYIRMVKDVGSREALSRRFFLIFQFEELRRGDSEDYGQVYSMMQTVEQNARAYFMQCGKTPEAVLFIDFHGDDSAFLLKICAAQGQVHHILFLLPNEECMGGDVAHEALAINADREYQLIDVLRQPCKLADEFCLSYLCSALPQGYFSIG